MWTRFLEWLLSLFQGGKVSGPDETPTLPHPKVIPVPAETPEVGEDVTDPGSVSPPGTQDPPSGVMILKLGDQGPSVKLAQERLNLKGYVVKADGDFGQKTYAAVEQFQMAQGLKVDGEVGAQTWDLLMAEGRAPTPEEVLVQQRDWLKAQIPKGTPPHIREVLLVACEDLGLRELDEDGNPAGTNAGNEIAHLVEGYNQYWMVLTKEGQAKHKAGDILFEADYEPPYPWCGMAVSGWIRIGLGLLKWDASRPGHKLDGHPFGTWFGGVTQIRDWGRECGKYTDFAGGKACPAGSVFVMAREGSGSDPGGTLKLGHTGMIVADLGDQVLTIEGNISNSVGTRKRRKSDLVGYVIWW